MHLHLRRAILLFAPLIAAYPQPEPCEGWCFKHLRDPNVVIKNGTYYRFTTHGNFTISTAPAMKGPWNETGHALKNGTMITIPMPKPKAGKNGEPSPPLEYKSPALWAPDVLLIDDTYYMTYTVTRGGGPDEI